MQTHEYKYSNIPENKSAAIMNSCVNALILPLANFLSPIVYAQTPSGNTMVLCNHWSIRSSLDGWKVREAQEQVLSVPDVCTERREDFYIQNIGY
jgi:hypothetical protein